MCFNGFLKFLNFFSVFVPNGHCHRAGEDVDREGLDPLVPVALVELGTV